MSSWPPSTPPRPFCSDTTPPADLPDPSTGLTISSTASVIIVNSVTTGTDALILLVFLVFLTPVLGKRAPSPWSSCSPWPSCLALLVRGAPFRQPRPAAVSQGQSPPRAGRARYLPPGVQRVTSITSVIIALAPPVKYAP